MNKINTDEHFSIHHKNAFSIAIYMTALLV